MAAKRCVMCGKNFPLLYNECPRCGRNLELRETLDPSPDWRDYLEEPVMPPLSELDRVAFWRLECLLHEGFPPEVADVIAASKADLHEACRLLQRGCEPQTVQYLLT